ncbi:MAG: hypothetical protein HY650_16155 [Acidobacteria bacterium]|nr:hypothetical protein [Acidobacteriota bacterium]
MRLSIGFRPLTIDQWPALERLFGERGACGGCWCMWWRLKRSEYERLKGKGNREALKRIVQSGEVPGLLAFDQGEPVAWCALGPRDQYVSLERSRILKRVDDQPVWSITCFFVARPFRRRGITMRLELRKA